MDNQFTLKWQTENAVALTVDGQLETVPSGSQSYTLQTHTYELTATGPDGSRQIKGISVQVIGDCEVTVNGLQATVKSDRCRLLQQSQSQPSPSPTATLAPTFTAAPLTPAASPTARPTSALPANAFPTETPALTYTPAPSDTPAPPPTAFPTDTPSPAPSTPGQDTPVGGT